MLFFCSLQACVSSCVPSSEWTVQVDLPCQWSLWGISTPLPFATLHLAMFGWDINIHRWVSPPFSWFESNLLDDRKKPLIGAEKFIWLGGRLHIFLLWIKTLHITERQQCYSKKIDVNIKISTSQTDPFLNVKQSGNDPNLIERLQMEALSIKKPLLYDGKCLILAKPEIKAKKFSATMLGMKQNQLYLRLDRTPAWTSLAGVYFHL